MVKGLELFRDFFRGYEDCYTLIGGAACDLWMGELGLKFRATKDLDVVLVFDGQRPDFVKRLWEFVENGGYEGYRGGEEPQNFYRFQKPATGGFPYKLEICAKRPIDVPQHVKIAKIPAGEDVSSLSAILLDEQYYELVRRNGRTIQGVPTVTGACLIPLKVKAWLNLSERKQNGENIDQHDIDKHRTDVFRLLMTLTLGDTIELTQAIRNDFGKFIEKLPTDSPAWKSIAASLKSTSNLTLPPPIEIVTIYRKFAKLN
jgi:hypothetical protein